MMDFHVLTPAGPELLMRVVDGKLVVVPPPEHSPEIPQPLSAPEKAGS